MRRNALGLWGALVAASLLVGCGAATPDAARSPAIASGIIGGGEVPSTHPLVRSVVGIYLVGATKELSWCTGILLPNNIVLTAAHCVTDLAKMVVLFGATPTSASPHARIDGVKVSQNWGALHPDGKNEGDIALLHFAGAAPAGVIPLPILPPDKQNLFPAGTQVILAGYGINDGVRNTGSGTLRMVTARLGNPNYSPTEIMIDQTQGKGACHGDSGGPVLVVIGNQAYVWGVINGGINDPKNDCSQLLKSANVSVWKGFVDRETANLLRDSNGGRNNSFNSFPR